MRGMLRPRHFDQGGILGWLGLGGGDPAAPTAPPAGPTQQQSPYGMLDPQLLAQARSAGLLSAAGAMIAGGAPSPVPGAGMRALGGALQAYPQGQQGFLHNALAANLLNQQVQSAAYQNQLSQRRDQIATNWFGGPPAPGAPGIQPAQVAQAAVPAPIVPPNPAQPGAPNMAARMNFGPTGQPPPVAAGQPQAQTAAAPTGGSGFPFKLPPGMDMQSAAALYWTDPKTFVTEMVKQYPGPSGLSQLITEKASLPPNSQFASTYDAAIRDKAGLGMANVRQGGSLVDQATGKVIYQAPVLGTGIHLVDNTGGTPGTHAEAVPGFIPSVKAIETATGGAKEAVKNDQERIGNYISEANTNQQLAVGVKQLRDIIKGGYRPGVGAEMAAWAGAYADRLDLSDWLPDSWNVNDARAFDKVTTNLIFGMANNLKGQVKIGELTAAQKANPDKSMPLDANLRILDTLDSTIQYQNKRAEGAVAYANGPGNGGLGNGAFEIAHNKANPQVDLYAAIRNATKAGGYGPRAATGSEAPPKPAATAAPIAIGTTATGPNGEKKRWNGMTWGPVQ